MSITWRNRAFNVCQVEGGIMAHMVDDKGVIIFRWRMYYDDATYEQFTVPFGVIEHFETFKALCRQFDTPEDANKWYSTKLIKVKQ